MTSILGTEPNLSALWKFEEGTGTTSSDSSSGGHNGTSVNGPTWLARGPTTAKGNGLMAQYFMTIELADTTPPFIASVVFLLKIPTMHS